MTTVKDLIDAALDDAFDEGDRETVARHAQRYGQIIRDVSWSNERGEFRNMHIACGPYFWCFTRHNGDVVQLERLPRDVS